MNRFILSIIALCTCMSIAAMDTNNILPPTLNAAVTLATFSPKPSSRFSAAGTLSMKNNGQRKIVKKNLNNVETSKVLDALSKFCTEEDVAFYQKHSSPQTLKNILSDYQEQPDNWRIFQCSNRHVASPITATSIPLHDDTETSTSSNSTPSPIFDGNNELF